MLRKFYVLIASLMIGTYGVGEMRGWEFGNPERAMVPADARSSPGGYRSFHFWHSGFHGGK